ncbi:hypothetical protein ACN23B_27440 (plasmid) [Anabaena sp. FACHB-709]|uniref:Uncharacterized protein n=1 Tax=Anabaena cylindrica FACHB-318 TaxID=2692880 RepID=A0ABR7ZRV4_ANACY|nr:MULTISPECIES: hypothetical protein [Nostocaceae]MBD2174936.1 hypothetical protein [Anabaena cylindrica FACHB-318]MBD2266691.1 hypothetical protein [Anabaena sp. FACHB-709]MBD2276337.1 hypothetical protein [Nostoc sp. PCC 7120 = FACHB-418]MBD2286935.1 hypothetical protein [Anabaena cylindrica FACHB-170]MBD2352517.1 hypothetical protein [Trichormus variabilis FACHB-171]
MLLLPKNPNHRRRGPSRWHKHALTPVDNLRKAPHSNQLIVTVINPDNVGTPEVLVDLAAGNLSYGEAIALGDLFRILDCIFPDHKLLVLKRLTYLQC